MTPLSFLLLLKQIIFFLEKSKERIKSMASRFCDSCKSTAAILYCHADAAFLCGECDGKIHRANKLASRHGRVWLCEVCEQAPAHVTCKADAAVLCITCDRDIHSANPLSRRHERVPITPFYDASPVSAKSASSSVNFLDETDADADVTMEAASWLLPKEGIEIPNLFSDLGYPKMETASENSSGNDGVVPVQNKSSHHQTMVLHEDYFNFDISASKTYTQTVSSTSLDVALVPESGGAATDISNTMTTTTPTIAIQLSPAEREARVLRYREKRKNRKFEKTIRYASRKAYAEMRPRIKGRFAKRTDSRDDNGGGDVGAYGGFGVVPSF